MALREIRKFQKSTELLIRKLPFSRLVSGTAAVKIANACGNRVVFLEWRWNAVANCFTSRFLNCTYICLPCRYGRSAMK